MNTLKFCDVKIDIIKERIQIVKYVASNNYENS